MARKTKRALIKKGTLVVVVDVAATMHPDDRKFIKDRLCVEKDHPVYITSDNIDYLFAVCDDLSQFSNVVINNPTGHWIGHFIAARLGYLSGLSAMNGQAIYQKTFTILHIPVYEKSNTGDDVVVDLIRAV